MKSKNVIGLSLAAAWVTMANAETGAITKTTSATSEVGAVAADYVLGEINSELSDFSNSMLGDRFKYLSLSLNRQGSDVYLEGMSVFKLHEDKNWFLFNQTSLISDDGGQTLNFGLGARHITDDETIIVGANAFYDWDLTAGHKRVGVGGEFLTSIAQLRANYYKGLTGEILTNGVYSQALNGYDIKFTYELPFFYDSDISYKRSAWYDGNGFVSRYQDIEVSAEVAPNLTLRVGGTRDGSGKNSTNVGFTFSHTFGAPAETRQMRDGQFRIAMEPIRHMLYQPVQRENRIVKKSIKLGVTVSGY